MVWPTLCVRRVAFCDGTTERQKTCCLLWWYDVPSVYDVLPFVIVRQNDRRRVTFCEDFARHLNRLLACLNAFCITDFIANIVDCTREPASGECVFLMKAWYVSVLHKQTHTPCPLPPHHTHACTHTFNIHKSHSLLQALSCIQCAKHKAAANYLYIVT